MSLRRPVLLLGVTQLLCWGVSYYLIGVMGERIVADTGWSRERVYAGFSLALLVMGVASPWIGRLIDRLGGRPVMAAGSMMIAVGCLAMALARSYPMYLAAWLLMGLAMRCTLYDAAFAALARIGGVGAGRAMAQVTLLGGLASTVLWPVGHLLAEQWGWRGALFVYAAIALATTPMHLALPRGRAPEPLGGARGAERPLADLPRDRFVAGGLFAVVATMASFLNSGMSSHMIGLLSGLGLAASTAVWAATLRGVGQSMARLCDVLFGARLHPLTTNLGASIGLPISFALAFLTGQIAFAALAFAFLYGASNGLLTIARGAVPLRLFDPLTYGAFVGRLIAPGWIVAAIAPVAYAAAIERFGAAGGLWLSLFAAATALVASALLWRRYRPR